MPAGIRRRAFLRFVAVRGRALFCGVRMADSLPQKTPARQLNSGRRILVQAIEDACETANRVGNISWPEIASVLENAADAARIRESLVADDLTK